MFEKINLKIMLLMPVLNLVLLMLTPSQACSEESLENKGLLIAKKIDLKDSGWIDQVVNITMTLVDKKGSKNIREVRSELLEVDGDGDKSLVIFHKPNDVKGTVLLSYTHKFSDDDQWLYLPAIKRVKRISSSNKSGPFMGSDFAYEDISSQEVEKYTYQFKGESDYEGNSVYLLERTPIDKNSGYKRQLMWVDSKRYIPLKVDYYDRKDSLLKTQFYNDYNLHNDKYWRVNNLTMENHQKGTKTMIDFRDYRLSTGIDLVRFNHAGIKRVR